MKRDDDEGSREQEGIEEGDMPMMKKGENCWMQQEWRRKIQKWGYWGEHEKPEVKDYYHIKNLKTWKITWIDLGEYVKIFWKYKDEEEMMLIKLEDEVTNAKLKKLKSWKENEMYE